ncbi:MAG: hypothetical protein K2G12_10090, partial [Prevotella sp.]|nr:hypothetical protein [Prevotella sp.]
MKYNHIRTITTAIISLLTVAAFSIPAKRVWRTAQLANGTAIEVMLVGDENGHWYIDKDGKALAKDKEGKLYYLTT